MGKVICPITSARICLSLLVANKPPTVVFLWFPRTILDPLTKLMNYDPLLAPHLFRALSTPASRAPSTWMCFQVYLQLAKDLEQANRTMLLSYHTICTTGLITISVHWAAKPTLLVSIVSRSCHDTFFARIESHLSQLPRFFLVTALVIRALSSPCLTSFWTSSLYSWLFAELNQLLVYAT